MFLGHLGALSCEAPCPLPLELSHSGWPPGGEMPLSMTLLRNPVAVRTVIFVTSRGRGGGRDQRGRVRSRVPTQTSGCANNWGA